jgi:hypothetical protein
MPAKSAFKAILNRNRWRRPAVMIDDGVMGYPEQASGHRPSPKPVQI